MMRCFTIFQGDELRIPYQLAMLDSADLVLQVLDGAGRIVEACSVSTDRDDRGLYGWIYDTAELPAGMYWLVLDAASSVDSQRITDKLIVNAGTPPSLLGWA